MRKLASIQRIRSLAPIPGADAIEKATVLGWQLVVKRAEFQVDELCVYIEIDSLLPEREPFEFLRSRSFRIRTVKLRGQVSQGICFPLSVLPQGTTIEEGADVTALLGIVKYEPPIPLSLSGIVKGSFPCFIPKTDETRVQVLGDLLQQYAGQECYITEKLDGSSATFYLRDEAFGVCSRNLELVEDAGNGFWKMARQLDLESKLKSLGKNLALQGELTGEGIQGNKLQLKGQQWFCFGIYFIDEARYASFDEWIALTEQLALPRVPVLDSAYLLEADIDSLLEKAQRRSVLAGARAEGIVIRVKQAGEHVSFKAINNEFLLHYGE
ncbi:RNA ligase (ATP) [Taibaiella koreensis]|uniref:RNA ligase (ATP) n=1 Tax=Taibaiella koreensis TaxID=1268548 RepID=UPI000E599932|nr:RNA ligase (ATP) [Taibaiella koreensis]